MTGIELIAQERLEQVLKHNRTIDSDKRDNNDYQLVMAASILISHLESSQEESWLWFTPRGWDVKTWQHMCSKPYKERLVIAGALMAAEIDRISDI